MAQQNAPGNSLVISYLELRKAIGYLGIALPFVVAVGVRLLQGLGIQSSISSYYYTVMGDVFVGTLCAIGVFLLSYKGYERKDELAGNLACIFTVGVALFPTSPENASSHDKLIGTVHAVFASLFFLTISYFALFLFTKTDPSKPPTRRKLQRNRVYRICGYTMLTAIALALAYSLAPESAVAGLKKFHPVFWLEAIAVEAFGIAWMTKGEAILKDEV